MNITPYTKNAKKHPKKQVEQVAASIKEFGMNQPIVVDKEGVIIVGHGRYEALQHLGWEIKDEWIKTVDLTEEQAKAYRLADNKLNESDWDMDLVIEELKGLTEPLIDLTGFDKDLIIEPDEKDDEVPELPEEPQSILGDLYELGEHRVLCGDSTDMDTVEKLMDGKKADMVFTDPPYGNNLGYGRGKLGERTIKSDETTEVVLASIPVVNSFLKDNSHYLLFTQWRTYAEIETQMKAESLKIRSVIVWDKKNAGLSGGGLAEQHEWLIVGIKGKATQRFYSGNVWSQSREMNKRSESLHPHMKPIELLSKGMDLCTESKTLVLETFLGSGSTLIAAEKTGRICYGMELNPKYCDVIVQRYVDYTGNAKIKKNGKEITWTKTSENKQ